MPRSSRSGGTGEGLRCATGPAAPSAPGRRSPRTSAGAQAASPGRTAGRSPSTSSISSIPRCGCLNRCAAWESTWNRVLLVEQARVEPLIVHRASVLQTTTRMRQAPHPRNQPESPCGSACDQAVDAGLATRRGGSTLVRQFPGSRGPSCAGVAPAGLTALGGVRRASSASEPDRRA